MPAQVFVLNFRDPAPTNAIEVNATSRSKVEWQKALSPFFLGPVDLYDGYVAQNVENGWQHSKCYPKHVDSEGNPTPEYWEWAKAGWANEWAERYPMGKGAKPLFSLWRGQKLGYIEARKQIYIPLYSKAVAGTAAFGTLCKLYESSENLVIRDFDAYPHRPQTLNDVLNNPNKKMGHGFVLAMLLTREI